MLKAPLSEPFALNPAPYPRTLRYRVTRLLGQRVVVGAFRDGIGMEIEAFFVSVVPAGGEPILRGHGDEQLPRLLQPLTPEETKLRFYLPAWLTDEGEKAWLSVPLSRLAALRRVKSGQVRAIEEMEQRIAREAAKRDVTVIWSVQ